MSRSSMPVNYRRGVASLVILSLLKRGDMYGYQIVQEMSRQTDGKLAMQEGSLYPVLYRLLENGHITDEKKQVGKRMTRVYYHIEPSGEAYLELLIKEYNAVTNGVFQIVNGTKPLDTDED